MKIEQFDYKLPKENIAHSPVSPRDHSKLLVFDRKTGSISHKHFYDLADILTANDVLVFNETKVIPGRLFGRKETGGRVEILLLDKLKNNTWTCIGKNIPDKNKKIIFDDEFSAEVLANDQTISKIRFDFSQVKIPKFFKIHGTMPLPPYIDQNRPHKIDSKRSLDLKTAYNTVYASIPGSAAAPTAGLHFTKKLLSSLRSRGVGLAKVNLNVGLGTFKPIQTRTLNEHKMHTEKFTLSKRVAQYLNEKKREGKRIIAVGTTTTRVLETCVDKTGFLKQQSGSTDIFIYPPYQFRFVDSLITNFHLPKSTLLALISAFTTKPNSNSKFKDFRVSKIGKAYAEAIKKGYRFYSFGDSMIII